MKFKINFPSGYQIINELNDNIDINIYLENGDVFFGTLFTIENLRDLLDKSDVPFFYAVDLVIVKDLSKKTIKHSISHLVLGSIEFALTKIKSVSSGHDNIFDEIKDMC